MCVCVQTLLSTHTNTQTAFIPALAVIKLNELTTKIVSSDILIQTIQFIFLITQYYELGGDCHPKARGPWVTSPSCQWVSSGCTSQTPSTCSCTFYLYINKHNLKWNLTADPQRSLWHCTAHDTTIHKVEAVSTWTLVAFQQENDITWKRWTKDSPPTSWHWHPVFVRTLWCIHFAFGSQKIIMAGKANT